jgi:GMP reductase
MKIENEVLLDFSDVLIRPKRSQSPSRHNVNLNRNYKFLHSKQTFTSKPIFAANMSTVGTFAIARELHKQGLLTCLHKFYSASELINFWLLDPASKSCFYTLGIKDEDFAKLNLVSKDVSLTNICLDVANGYTEFFVDKVKKTRDLFPDAVIMAGNVSTSEMVQELLFAGADIVKIGIGPGSSCTTRIVTGVGIPQLSAIIECADAAHGLQGHICADGGCTTSGDICKAIGSGADFVMLGGMLAGCDECEGEWEYNQKQEKINFEFYGMSSTEAMIKYYGGQAAYKAAEGKKISIPYKGRVEDKVNEILGGLRSSCTYVGTENIKDFSKCCTFVRVNRTHNTVYN